MTEIIAITGLVVAFTALVIPLSRLFFRHVKMRSKCALNDDIPATSPLPRVMNLPD